MQSTAVQIARQIIDAYASKSPDIVRFSSTDTGIAHLEEIGVTYKTSTRGLPGHFIPVPLIRSETATIYVTQPLGQLDPNQVRSIILSYANVELVLIHDFPTEGWTFHAAYDGTYASGSLGPIVTIEAATNPKPREQPLTLLKAQEASQGAFTIAGDIKNDTPEIYLLPVFQPVAGEANPGIVEPPAQSAETIQIDRLITSTAVEIARQIIQAHATTNPDVVRLTDINTGVADLEEVGVRFKSAVAGPGLDQSPTRSEYATIYVKKPFGQLNADRVRSIILNYANVEIVLIHNFPTYGWTVRNYYSDVSAGVVTTIEAAANPKPREQQLTMPKAQAVSQNALAIAGDIMNDTPEVYFSPVFPPVPGEANPSIDL